MEESLIVPAYGAEPPNDPGSVDAGARHATASADDAPDECSDPGSGCGAPPSGGLEVAGDPDRVWNEIQNALRDLISREKYETWFRRAALARLEQERLHIAVQNTFARDWLSSRYRQALEQAASRVLGRRVSIEFVVDPELSVRDRGTPPEADFAVEVAPASNGAAPHAGGASNGAAGPRPGEHGRADAPPDPESTPRLLWDSDVVLNPAYRFEKFVVGPCNRFAHAASLGVAEHPGTTYNPYFLHGSVGLGKTHLLQSLCYSILDREARTRILYLSCETFVNHFISALENGDLTTFRNKYRNVDVLVVDDIHLLANKERTQEEFFHTFNTIYNAGKQIVLSSDSPPKEIPTLQDRLVSRFKWGLVTEIEPPCYETRMAILKRKSRTRGRELPEDVARLLAEHIDTNIRELEGAVTRVIGYAGLSQQEITCDLARSVLRDVFQAHRTQPTMEDVLRVVTAHFNVKVTDLQSRRRTNAIAHPRQIGMYLARKITRHSLEEIGGFFGGRDHSTVLYAVEKIEKQIAADDGFKALIARFLEGLRTNG